jgi:hypothetical protein
LSIQAIEKHRSAVHSGWLEQGEAADRLYGVEI